MVWHLLQICTWCHWMPQNLRVYLLATDNVYTFFYFIIIFVPPRSRVSLHPLEADSLLLGWLPNCQDWGGDLWHNRHEAKCKKQCKQICSTVWRGKKKKQLCPFCMHIFTTAAIMCNLSDLLFWFAARPGLHRRHRLQRSAVWDVKDFGVQDALETS